MNQDQGKQSLFTQCLYCNNPQRETLVLCSCRLATDHALTLPDLVFDSFERLQLGNFKPHLKPLGGT